MPTKASNVTVMTCLFKLKYEATRIVQENFREVSVYC